MLQEEVRLNTSFASGKGFFSFPILFFIQYYFKTLTNDGISKASLFESFT